MFEAKKKSLKGSWAGTNKIVAVTDRIIKLDAKNVTAWVDRGVIAEELKDMNEAIRSFDRALELEPKTSLHPGT